MENFKAKALNIAINKNKPTSLIHFVTNRCNARCPHCFIDFDDFNSQNSTMELYDIEKMTKNLGDQLMNVNITGGEPFLEPNLEEICSLYLRNTTIDSMFFSTNGSQTNKIFKIAKSLSEQYPHVLFTYSISIDEVGDKHNNYRKVKNLYQNAIKTYHKLSTLSQNVQANVTITVCEANTKAIEYIFNSLFYEENVKTLTANLVRDEGIYKTNRNQLKDIHAAYVKLCQLIKQNNAQYQPTHFISRMMNKKELIMYQNIADQVLNPNYVMPCNAGAGLLGVIYPNGDVYPCEILNKKMGNLHDYDMDLLSLWEKNEQMRKEIRKNKCHCTYECAWSFNILSSPKHISKLALSALKD